jgi:hypothetical protein
MSGIPKATAIILTTAERTELEVLARSTKTEHRLRQRARIVLLASGGLASRAIGRAVGCTTGTASKWRVRYADKRFGGLDETGDRGAEPKYTAETGKRILALLDQPKPKGYANRPEADAVLRCAVVAFALNLHSVRDLLGRSGAKAGRQCPESGASAHPRGRRQTLLPAEILAGPQPDRAGLRQDQASLAQGRHSLSRNHLHRDRRNPWRIHARRMRQLFPKLWLRAGLNASCSSEPKRYRRGNETPPVSSDGDAGSVVRP